MPTLGTYSSWLQNNVSALDAQLATSVAQSYATSDNKRNLYESIIANKNTDIQTANADLLAQSNAIHGLYYYRGRNNQLNNVNKSLLGTTTGQADALLSDNDLAKRQNEINEWETGNKMDTLFVYQQFLIILCTSVVLSYLWKSGIIGNTVFTTLMIVLVLVFILTVVNRAQYTNLKRDTRYWHQRRFPTSEITTPSACDIANTIVNDTNNISRALADLGGYGTSNTGVVTSGV
jgi:hypothetical protein